MLKSLLLSASLLLPLASYAGTIVDGYPIQSEVVPFNENNALLNYCGDYLCFIDGHMVHGTDGKTPSTQLKGLTVLVDGKEVSLDVSGMYDPFINEDELVSRASITPYWGDLKKLTVRFSDGAGGYAAQWIFSSKGSSRVFLGSPEQVFELQEELFN
jgi:hypothetical protein